MPEKQVVVVGAGIGGLVASIRLAHEGLNVTVLERSNAPGGKLRTEWVDGKAIDAGPTVFTMKWVFDELMESVDTRLDAELQLQSLPCIGRHFWEDGSSLDLWTDMAANESAVEAFAGPDEVKRFKHFCDTTRALYDHLEGPFIRSQTTNVPRFMASLGPRGLALLVGIGPMRVMWDSMTRHFKDPRLQQLFARYATYCGSSPWQAPATLSLITQVEMDGVWSVEGGMSGLAQCLERIAIRKGVQFRYGEQCQEIALSNGRVSSVITAKDKVIATDVVIFNGDAAALRQGLLGQGARAAVRKESGQRSLSAVTWSLLAKTSGVALDRHNIFFGSDYASEFTDIFKHKRLSERPTVYVCAQDRNSGNKVTNQERLLCLINAPAVGDGPVFSEETIKLCQERSFSLLKRCGLDVELNEELTVCTTPTQFHQRFPGTGGALYGQATHGWLSIFSRPGSMSPVPGLYLAGGSVHPGPGVPMAAMSGRLAAAAVMENLGLIRSSHKMVTSGGMSTPSVMTANMD